MSDDTIFIEGLTIETIIGVYERERNIKQQVIFNLSMMPSENTGADSDDLRHTVDYDAVSKRVTDFVSNTQYQLIESLAESVASLVLNEFAVRELKLKLSKPGAVSNAANVGIKINRKATI